MTYRLHTLPFSSLTTLLDSLCTHCTKLEEDLNRDLSMTYGEKVNRIFYFRSGKKWFPWRTDVTVEFCLSTFAKVIQVSRYDTRDSVIIRKLDVNFHENHITFLGGL